MIMDHMDTSYSRPINYPTKHMCILVPAPYDTIFVQNICSDAENAFFSATLGMNLYYIWWKFIIIIEKKYSGTASSNSAIWDEFS